MNYKKIYDSLIDRAKNRERVEGIYYENHHIIPKCIGGTDSYENKVLLTAREHFLCHWLLTKLYSDPKLVFAWNSFCMNTYNGDRPTSHLYEHARIKYVELMKARIRNGEFTRHSPKGSIWMTDGDKCIRVNEKDVDIYLESGWKKGRLIKSRKPHSEITKRKMREAKVGKTVVKSDACNVIGRIWINNGAICKMVTKKDLEKYLTSGWNIGRIIKKRKLSVDEMLDYRKKIGQKYLIMFPDGNTKTINNLKLFCEDYNLNEASMHKVASGKQSHHKGFSCKRVKKINT